MSSEGSASERLESGTAPKSSPDSMTVEEVIQYYARRGTPVSASIGPPKERAILPQPRPARLGDFIFDPDLLEEHSPPDTEDRLDDSISKLFCGESEQVLIALLGEDWRK